MDSVLCVLLMVSSNGLRVVIELGEFMLRGPVRNARGWQGKEMEVGAGGSVSLRQVLWVVGG